MSSERDFEDKIRDWIGNALVPVFARLRRRESAMVARELHVCWRLEAEWYRLADIDREAGIEYDADDGQGHLAYLAYEAECSRLWKIPLPLELLRWYGWRSELGAMTTGCETYGALASLSSLCGHSNKAPRPDASRLIPLRRREWYAVIGWRYSAPPSEEQKASWDRLAAAMSRVDATRYSEVRDIGPFKNVHTSFLGRDYFEELVANLHEIHAESRTPRARSSDQEPR